MPASILEDSENLKKGGKSTLKLLFLLGITILIYLSSNTKEAITWLRNERSSEVSSEFIPSKPEELSFLLPKMSKPRTTSERNEREEKILNDMNTWMQKLLASKGESDSTTHTSHNKTEVLSELLKTKDPKILIKSTMKMGYIHPKEFENIAQEVTFFNLYLDNDNIWKVGDMTIKKESTETQEKQEARDKQEIEAP